MSLVLSREEFLSHQKVPISVLRREPQPPFNRHTHEFTELVVVLSGQATHVVDQSRFVIGVGDVFVLHQGEEHEFVDLQDLHLINVLFDPELVTPLIREDEDLPGLRALFVLEPQLRRNYSFESRLHLSIHELKEIQGIIRRLESELEARQAGFSRMVQAIFAELVLSLARCYHRLPPVQVRELLRVSRAIHLMEQQFTEPLRMEDLASVTNMSLRHFQRVFQKIMGMSPLEYLLNLRLMKAQTLLEQEDRSITDIALDCGFSDSNYFSRLFKQKIGKSPSQVKRG